MFPMGFLESFPTAHKISYSCGTETNEERRKLSANSPCNGGVLGFPALQNLRDQETISFLVGFPCGCRLEAQ